MHIWDPERARGRWRGILKDLGLDERYLLNRHQDCPLCGGTDRYRFDDKDGTGSYFCNKCGAGDGMKLAQGFTGTPFIDLAKRINTMIGHIPIDTTPKPTGDPGKALNRIWRETMPSAGTVTERYLASRGLICPPALRTHLSLGYYEAVPGQSKKQKVCDLPAMIGKFVLPDGLPATLHVTYLDEPGRKAGVADVKKTMPKARDLDGGAIRLFPIAEHIGVAEGIETAIAAHMLYGIPVWSCLNSLRLSQFVPPEGVTEITFFGDNDENYEGQAAAYGRARELNRKKYKTNVIIPVDVGVDFCDYAANANRLISENGLDKLFASAHN